MNNEFIEKNDYFGLADGTMLVCSSSEDGRSNEVAQATGQDGAIVAHNVYGEKIAPSNEYVMKAVTFSKGEVKEVETKGGECLKELLSSPSE